MVNTAITLRVPYLRVSDEASSMDIRESYDSAAAAYAAHLADELDCKPLDRHLLNRFAEATRAASGSLT